MSVTERSLILIAYAPALTGDDGRTLAVVRGMERALPGLRLEWKLAEGGRPVALPQRDAWLAEAAAGGKFPLVCNGDESHPVTVFGLERPAGISPGRQPRFEVHAELPLDAAVMALAADVLEGLAEGARTLWGHATPNGIGEELAQQTRHSAHGPERSPRGLPMLKLPEDIPSPEIPEYLGWLNYWSAAAAQSIGFPDPALDADLLARSRRTATGGWIVRLTEEPLNLNNPAHLDVLLRAYERFPEIGGRSLPRITRRP